MFEEGRRIRVSLAEIAKTQVWLINQLAKRGVVTDKTEMSAVLNCTRHGNKVDLILKTSAEILKEYRDGHGKENEQF